MDGAPPTGEATDVAAKREKGKRREQEWRRATQKRRGRGEKEGHWDGEIEGVVHY